jgi:hypothetical protein
MLAKIIAVLFFGGSGTVICPMYLVIAVRLSVLVHVIEGHRFSPIWQP